MKFKLPVWIIGLAATLAVVVIPLVIFWPRPAAQSDDPRAGVPQHKTHTPHTNLMEGTYASGPEVTAACLECHSDAATEFMATSHWTWESQPFDVPWREEPVTIGKANQINNFCIGAQGNQQKCMSCHTGYNWSEEQPYDFDEPTNVDCLVCHADTATYGRGAYGNVAEGIDLTVAAQSVRAPTRDNCGQCHFDGGGGNNVKHGDLSEDLYNPSPDIDIHMGREDFLCTDCHVTTDHQVRGRLIADNFTVDPAEQVSCTQCHNESLHEDGRLNAHVQSVACQTCHVPYMAVQDPTKVSWDWSTAGQDLGDDHLVYLKIKGSFIYERNVAPTYAWFNGNLEYRYLLGDTIDPQGVTYINKLDGDISDAQARIFPFKLHVSNQPYDVNYQYFLQPITAGPGGYFTEFNWHQAFRLAEEVMGLPYSGEYGFAQSYMYWPTTHMVQAKENALQCVDCHNPDGRLDWQALGYPGDPMEWGGRFDN